MFPDRACSFSPAWRLLQMGWYGYMSAPIGRVFPNRSTRLSTATAGTVGFDDAAPGCYKTAAHLPPVGPWRSWQRASMAWRRSWVRIPPAPPILNFACVASTSQLPTSVLFCLRLRACSGHIAAAFFFEERADFVQNQLGWNIRIRSRRAASSQDFPGRRCPCRLKLPASGVPAAGNTCSPAKHSAQSPPPRRHKPSKPE